MKLESSLLGRTAQDDKTMPLLGVNIDHVATLRQTRRGNEPDPIAAAKVCEKPGADSIVCHLREDRRHIQDADLRTLRKIVKTQLNLEMALNEEIVKIAASVKPDIATIVPERRHEITTEGGLDVIKYSHRIRQVTKFLQNRGIVVSLFIDAKKNQITEAKKAGARIIEFHTGRYAEVAEGRNRQTLDRELHQLKTMTAFALSLGLHVSAGHGLNYQNTRAVAKIKGIEELNIGHSIVSRAVFTGLKKAVREM